MELERKLLTRMAKKNGGVLKVEDVLEEARDENSILHRHFEWDNTEAAEKYRQIQARALIQKCQIKLVTADPVVVRAFVSLPTDRENGGGYRLTSDVVNDENLKAEMMRDMQMTIQRWTKKMHLLDQDIADALIAVEDALNARATPEQRIAAG